MRLLLQQWFMACITFTALTGWPLSCFHTTINCCDFCFPLAWFILSAIENYQSTCKRHLFTATTPTKIQKIRGLEFFVFPRRSRISSFSTDLNFRMTSTARLLPRRRGIVESSEPWRDKDAWKKMLQKIASQLKKELDINFLQHEGFIMRS